MKPEEIISQKETFTTEETDRINLLAAGAVDEITQEDIELYSRWKTSNALCEARFKIEQDTLIAESNARIEAANQIANAAIANLEAQAELAKARLEAVKNGQI